MCNQSWPELISLIAIMTRSKTKSGMSCISPRFTGDVLMYDSAKSIHSDTLSGQSPQIVAQGCAPCGAQTIG